VTNAIMTRAGFEVIPKRQRAKRRIATRTATINHRTIWVSFGPGGKEPGPINTIVDIDHAPGPVQSFAIGAAIAGAPPIIHIQNPDAAAGPVLNAQHQNGDSARRWPTVTLHQQQRTLSFWRHKIPVLWRIEKPVSS